MSNEHDPLPPLVQAVLDAVGELHKHGPGFDGQRVSDVHATWRAYDASRKKPERPHKVVRAEYVNATFPWAVLSATGWALAYHREKEMAHQHVAWLEADASGDLFTRAQVEERERAADRKAREECAQIARTAGFGRFIYAPDERDAIAGAIRASIKP